MRGSNTDYKSAPMALSVAMAVAKEAIELAIGRVQEPTYGGHRHLRLGNTGRVGARQYGERWTSFALVNGRIRAVGTHATRIEALRYAESRYLLG